MHLQHRKPRGLIENLTEMRGELSLEETELTDSALSKLQAMSDAEFAELELFPDFRNNSFCLFYNVFG